MKIILIITWIKYQNIVEDKLKSDSNHAEKQVTKKRMENQTLNIRFIWVVGKTNSQDTDKLF